MHTFLKENWGTIVGLITVAFVPLVFVDRINRFTALPQLWVALLGVLLGCVCISVFGARRSTKPVLLAAAGFYFLQVVSAIPSISPSLGVVPITTDFVYVSFLFLVVTGFSERDIDRTITASAIVCGGISLVGLAQYYEIGRHLIPTSGLPSGTLGHRNIGAAYAAALLPYIVLRFVHSEKKLQDALWAVCGMLTLAFVIATRSRAAWVALLVGVVVAVALWMRTFSSEGCQIRPTKWISAAIGCVLVVLVAITPSRIGKGAGEAMWDEKASLGQAVQSIAASGGDKGRLILWETTLEMIQNRPILGVGPGNWRIHYPLYAEGRIIDAKAVPHRPHNDLLSIWSESGTGAIVLFLVALFLGFKAGLPRIVGPNRDLLVSAIASITICVVSGLFGFPKEFVSATLPLWFGLGLLTVYGSSSDRALKNRLVPAVFAIPALVGLYLIGQLVASDRDALNARLARARSDWPSLIEATDNTGWLSANDETYLLRAGALEQVGRVDEALEAYKRGLDIHPHSTTLWLGRGVAQRSLGQISEALTSFEQALRFDPQDGRVLNNLGTLSASTGNLPRAIGYLERALEAESTPGDVYGNLSTTYRRAGEVVKAIETAREGMKAHTSSSLTNALGSALAAAGRHAEAVTAYNTGLSIDSDHVALWYNLARSLEVLERRGDAVRAYGEVLRRIGETLPDRRSFVEERIRLLERGSGSWQ
jgi:tetratricopeptide (TPR) repeat protein